jgi:hypothetical protein
MHFKYYHEEVMLNMFFTLSIAERIRFKEHVQQIQKHAGKCNWVTLSMEISNLHPVFSEFKYGPRLLLSSEDQLKQQRVSYALKHSYKVRAGVVEATAEVLL